MLRRNKFNRFTACGCSDTDQGLSQPLMMRRDYGSIEANDMFADFDKESRFHEGPKGKKEFKEWFEDQPKDFQDEWEENTEKYKDQFKKADLQRESRFHEGPKGKKEWQKWIKEQDFEDEWKVNTCMYGGTITGQAPKSQESCEKELNVKLASRVANKFINKQAGQNKFLNRTARMLIASIESEMNELLAEADKADEKAKEYKTAWSKQDLPYLKKSNVIPADLHDKLASSFDIIKSAEELVKKAVKDLKTTAKTKRKEARKLGKKANAIMDLQADSDGSYMSVSNINQMLTQLSSLADIIKHDTPLEDWVESKLAHAHQNIMDVASYMFYSPKS
jgi:vacuolar-type H+-ATPase subunit H